jgi:hypothetical protein
MSKTKKLLLLGIAIALVWVQFVPNLVFGANINNAPATAMPGQALEIDPPLIELRGNPGQTITSQIEIRNISSGPVIVTNQINDFVANGETGVPKILINNNTNDPYSLTGYIAAIPSFALKPNQLKTLNVDINIPQNASPGGHYGVIRFTGTPATLSGTASGVALSASLGALVLLTVNGHIVENLQNHSFTVSANGNGNSGFFQNDPFVFSEVIANSGNEHVVPTGLLTLKDMFGHTVLHLNINQGLGNVLPGSMRKFTETINKVDVGNKRFFGRYTATYNVSYGSPTKELSASLSFWVIPINLILIWIVVLIGGFFLIRHLIKRYNQHILDKAQKSSRTKK